MASKTDGTDNAGTNGMTQAAGNSSLRKKARREALLKELDEIYPEKSKDKTGSDSH